MPWQQRLVPLLLAVVPAAAFLPHAPAPLSRAARARALAAPRRLSVAHLAPDAADALAAAAAAFAAPGGLLLADEAIAAVAAPVAEAATALAAPAAEAAAAPAAYTPPAIPLGEFGGSSLSLYATLGLYVLSFPGLTSLVKRAAKEKPTQRTYVFDGPQAPGGREMRQIAGEVMAYFQASNYEVADAADVITFRGAVERSKSQAFFLSFCVALGLASLALVLQIQIPFIGAYWYSIVAAAPYAGVYYWQNAEDTSEVKVKLEMNDGETQAEMLVQGVKEDLERMARMMDLQERGKVRIRGIFEDAANGAPSGGDAAPAAADAAAAPPVSSE